MPSLFGDVGVLRDRRINVGHWNLPERSVEDVRLFRFSGYEPDAPERATRYADRLATESLGGAGEHFERYRAALLDAGWEEARAWPYAFDRFANGEPVPAIARALHDELGGERFGDPFAVGPGSFAAWLREPADARWPAVSRLWLELHARRDDLRAAFPEPLGADRRAFAGGRAAAARRSTACRRRSTRVRAGRARARWSRSPAATACRRRACSPRRCASMARACALHVVVADESRAYRRRGAVRRCTASASSTSPSCGLARRSRSSCACALKPAALAALLDEGHSAVLFLDPDQWVLGDLEPLWAAIERSAIMLTPHLTAPPSRSRAARASCLARAPTTPAALGVSDRPAARAMLAWWAERLDAANADRVDEGAYYDQRWLDLVPSLFDGVEVLRDERFNVGHWNLPERDAADVRLLHASGFDPERPRTVTGHDPRLDELEATRVAALLERYAEALLAAGAREAAALPWGWSRFADGTPVPRGAGELLAALGPDGAASAPTRSPPGPGSFAAWLASPADDGRRGSRGCGPPSTPTARTCARRSPTRWAPTARRSRAGSPSTARASTASSRRPEAPVHGAPAVR